MKVISSQFEENFSVQCMFDKISLMQADSDKKFTLILVSFSFNHGTGLRKLQSVVILYNFSIFYFISVGLVMIKT